jgi:hypothetical protein
MPSVRAEAVAEVLWELKRLEKLATFSTVAERAGFKAGAGGKNLLTCLESVRRDWPHLQWWRAVPDSCELAEDAEQTACLRSAGFAVQPVSGRKAVVQITDYGNHLFCWEEVTITV